MDDPWKSMPNDRGFESESRMVEVEDGWRLRVITCKPLTKQNNPPVVMVPGWNSVFEGWREIIEAWAPSRMIIYIETREKGMQNQPGSRVGRQCPSAESVQDLKTLASKLPEMSSECDFSPPRWVQPYFWRHWP